MNWDVEETILLVDLYNKLKKNDCNKKELIASFSDFLRIKAESSGYLIDDKFRNISGINMQLQNIIYLITKGDKGLSSYSMMHKKAVNLYIQDCKKFNIYICNILKKHEVDSSYKKLKNNGESIIGSKNTFERLTNNKDDFIKWLEFQKNLKAPANKTVRYLEEVSNRLKGKGLITGTLWECNYTNEFLDSCSFLYDDASYIGVNKESYQGHILAVHEYCNFIKQYSSNTELLKQNTINSETNIEDEQSDIAIYSDIENEFYDWLKSQEKGKDYPDRLVKCINEISDMLKEKGLLAGVLWDYSKASDLLDTCALLHDDADYVRINEKSFKTHRLAIIHYSNFIKQHYTDVASPNKKVKKMDTSQRESKNVAFALNNKKELFYNYLSSKERVKGFSSILVKCIDEVSNMLKEKGLITSVLWDHNKSSEFLRVCSALDNDSDFIELDENGKTFRMHKLAITHYSNFIKQHLSKSKSLYEKPINVIAITKESKILTDGTNDTKGLFLCWLKSQGKLKSYSNSTINYIEEVSSILNSKGLTTETLWNLNNANELIHTCSPLFDDEGHIKYSDYKFKPHMLAINRFARFLKKGNKGTSKSSSKNNTTIINESQKHGIRAINRNNENMNQENEFLEILTKHYLRGFKYDSAIDIKKFRRFYNELHHNDIIATDEEINKTLQSIGIEYGSNRIMSPENAIDKNTFKKVKSYIDKSFSNGEKTLYYQAIFSKFEKEISSTKIYNAKILKQVLMHFMQDEYYFKNSFLTKDKKATANPVPEIKSVLVKKHSAMNLDDISCELPNLTIKKIREALLKPEFINTNNGYYTHIDCVMFNNEDMGVIKAVIDCAVNLKGYISGGELIIKLKQSNANFFDENDVMTNLGIRNAIALRFKNDYDFNNSIISKKGKDLTIAKIMSNYCINKDTIEISELTNIAYELGLNSLPGAYLDKLKNDFIRASKNLFVRKGSFAFDTNVIDATIDRYCTGDYLSISEITSFALFHGVDLNWNIFLLESYVIGYSPSYKYLSCSNSVSKCIGAIVRKTSQMANYEYLMSDVLAKNTGINLNDTDSLIKHLIDRGYISNKRINNIEQIATKAKLIRETKG